MLPINDRRGYTGDRRLSESVYIHHMFEDFDAWSEYKKNIALLQAEAEKVKEIFKNIYMDI